jgi:hypothetical protein
VPPPVPAAPSASAAPQQTRVGAQRPSTTTPRDMTPCGALKIGRSVATVQVRMDEPDEVVDDGAQMVGGGGHSRIAVKQGHQYTWISYGNSVTLDRFLPFADGVLVSKAKAAREVVRCGAAGRRPRTKRPRGMAAHTAADKIHHRRSTPPNSNACARPWRPPVPGGMYASPPTPRRCGTKG